MIKTNTHLGGASHKLARILIMLLIFVALPLQMWGATSYQGVKLTKPSTIRDVYIIKTRSELLWWAINDQNKDIMIMADINVQGDKQLLKADGKTLAMNEKDIVVWPYLYYRRSNMHIEGNGHTISGIYQNWGYGKEGNTPGAIKSYDCVGFISWTQTKTTITDLNIADSYLVGKYAGGFIGKKEPTLFSTALSEYKNCTFRGYVRGTTYAGGFVGWHQSDGQDASFYRCINYGTIESGASTSNETDTGAGGLIGYLDNKHTGAAKTNTIFNRCVNYGNITCLTPGGCVGGHIGKVWDNNYGKREWRFCFNFGDITKYDKAKNVLAGSGLLGNYTNANGKVQPKILCCGNAKKSDTGSLLDSLSWNFKKHEPLVITGPKTMYNQKLYSSIQKDDSWASWWSNNYGVVTLAAVIAVATILSLGLGSTALAAYDVALAAYNAAVGAAADALAKAVMFWGVTFLASEALGVIAVIPGTLSLIIYSGLRAAENKANEMAKAPLTYMEGDVTNACFAYDANLMMQADSIGGELNDDKTILFKQHIDASNSAKSDTIPSIITNFESTTDHLYYGYDRCHRTPTVNNDPSLLNAPIAHDFDSHGECTYCHIKQEPLGTVLKSDNKTVDYYTIENQAQLLYLASAFNGDNEEAYKLYKQGNFKLIADIKFPEDTEWTPIGSCTESFAENNEAKSSSNWHPFDGFFDGQGHTITGLKTNEYTNYAGLFGYVQDQGHDSNTATKICNVNLSNCTFSGNIAGTIAGYVNNRSNAGWTYIDNVSADSSVMVIASGKNKESYGGGFIGEINREKSAWGLNIRYCYSNATILTNAADENTLGTFTGKYVLELSEKDNNDAPIFEHCYFGGTSIIQQAVGTSDIKGDISYTHFNDCYSIGDAANEKERKSPHYIDRNYITSGRLAYDLMNNSKQTENGVTTYFFTQKGNYPVLTTTKQPTLCKVKVGERNTGVQIADTIINTNATKLAAPIEYAGQKFDKAVLYGWNNENCEGDPVYKGQLNDFSELYKTPTRYYALVLNPENIPAVTNVQNAAEWKGAGVLAGYAQTNIVENLYLQGANAWSLQQAPQCIDGTNKTVIAGMPLISDVNGSISSARKYFRARSNAPSTQSETENITIQNMRLMGDVLAQDVLSKGNRSLTLNNLILQPISARKVTLDWNTETQAENAQGYNFKNVICKQADSTSVAFYKNGSEVVTTIFSDENKNNDYEHILNYMLSQDGMLDVFGLRLSGKNEKVAGKMGFATEENKRIYRVTLYNQSTGLADGEVLMNYDGDITFDVKGSRVGAMHEGVPAGTFAVLPLTEAELGASFKYLGKNVITKDGKATCIRLEEDKIDGFKYPACLGDDVTLRANRGEFVRQVRRDGSLESLMLPFGFMSLEFDEKEFSENDEVELCFADFGEEEGDNCLSADGSTLKLISTGAYQLKQEALQGDSLGETEVALPNVPYLVRLKCAERTDETTAITFSLDDSRYGGGVVFFQDADLLSALFDPMFGVFQNCAVGEIESAKGKKVYLLESFLDEATGKMQGKFVRAKDTDRLNAFHCYVATSSSLAGDEIKVSIDEGTSTGINAIKGSTANDKKKIYDMLGRRVNKMTPRNIYIQNGKKIVKF